MTANTFQFRFSGNAGPAGPVGPAGPQGIQGPSGASGGGVPVGGTTGQILTKLSNADFNTGWGAAGGGVSDGDKGDIVVSGAGTVWTIDTAVVTYAKMQNVSATARFLVRKTAGAGPMEEGTAADAKTILGVGDLTRVNDTNVTATLGGTPAGALLNATSITLGWTGLLDVTRGGTGAGTFTAYTPICGGTTSTGPHQSVASIGSSGQVLTSNGAGLLPTFQAPAAATFPYGLVQGLTISNDITNPNTDISIAAGAAADTGNAAVMVLASAKIKKLSAVWAVGSGVGGLDTGTSAVSTWYHVFLIQRSDTLVVDVLMSLSATAPTMPTNYDRKRWIGAIFNTAAPIIRPFTQVADTFYYTTPALDVNNTTIGTSAVSLTLAVPTNIVTEAIVAGAFNNSAASVFVTLSPLMVTDQAPLSVGSIATFVSVGVGVTMNIGMLRILTNTSGQIRGRTTQAANNTLQLATLAWRGFP
jgi:hypothetical protein